MVGPIRRVHITPVEGLEILTFSVEFPNLATTFSMLLVPSLKAQLPEEGRFKEIEGDGLVGTVDRWIRYGAWRRDPDQALAIALAVHRPGGTEDPCDYLQGRPCVTSEHFQAANRVRDQVLGAGIDAVWDVLTLWGEEVPD